MPRTKQSLEQLQQLRRQQILKNSLRLFAIKGYDATSVNDIAASIGFSHGLIYHYFTDKEEIFTTLLDQSLALGYLPLFPQLSSEQLANPLTTLKQIVTHIYDELEREDSDFGYYFYLFLNMRFQKTAPAPRFKVPQKEQRPFGIIVRLIEAGQRLGVFGGGDARDIAVLFFASMRGLTYAKLNSESKFALPSINSLMNIFIGKAVTNAETA
jgi:AcrR family transcriptional regulator